MPGDELARIDKWLVATLAADAVIKQICGDPARIYSDIAPPESVWPYVLFQYQGGSDVMGQGPFRIMVDAVYTIRGVHRSESYGGDVRALSDRLTTILHASAGAVDDAAIFSCVREQPFRLTELEAAGVQYRHAGGIFRILCQIP